MFNTLGWLHFTAIIMTHDQDVMITEDEPNVMLLENFSNFEWLDSFDKFDNVFKIHGLLLENSRPDYDTVTLDDKNPDQDLSDVLVRHFGPDADYIQVIFKNNHAKEDCKHICPYFRVFMSAINTKTPINYKLENFLKRCNSSWTQVRCEQALIFGLFSPTDTSRFASVPFDFQNYYESLSAATCASSATKTSYISLSGNIIKMPCELYWSILRFIIHPCASIIKEYWRLFDTIWDNHFMCIKQAWKNYNLGLH